MSELERISYVT